MMNSDSYGINNYKFLQATNPSYGNYQQKVTPQQINTQEYQYTQQKAHQQTKPYSFIPTQDDMETAMAFAESLQQARFSPDELSQLTSARTAGSVNDPRGAAFNGFNTPEFNGTGDLIPDVRDEEHGRVLNKFC